MTQFLKPIYVVLLNTMFLFSIPCKAEWRFINDRPSQAKDMIPDRVIDSLSTIIVNLIGDKKIIGLGEGTHGTSEFNKIRSSVSKKLVIQKGFKYVCFEDNFGEIFLFSTQQNAKNIVDKKVLHDLMQEHFFSLYQNQETQDFISWLIRYNRENRKEPITFMGIDYAEAFHTVEILRNSTSNIEECKDLFDRLKSDAAYIDSCRNSQSILDRKLWLKKGIESYDLIDSIQKIAITKKGSESPFNLSIVNIRLCFETFNRYRLKAIEPSRDSLLYGMVKQLKECDNNAKILIWAHNGHVAKGEFFEGEKAMGNYLKDSYPNQYFSIGTLTSEGKYQVTKDLFPTRYNRFFPIKLQKPVSGSVERYLQKEGKDKLVVYPGSFGKSDFFNEKVFVRVAGYNFTKANTFREIDLWSCFDALVYFRKTNPSSLFH